MAMWKNDDEMFALMKEKLYTPVVGDILDQMGYKHQFLPASIRPLAAQVPTAPYILPGGRGQAPEGGWLRLHRSGKRCV